MRVEPHRAEASLWSCEQAHAPAGSIRIGGAIARGDADLDQQEQDQARRVPWPEREMPSMNAVKHRERDHRHRMQQAVHDASEVDSQLFDFS